MALFENFPYTNLHELNLDWLINELNRIKESAVISVNGMTGDVILYENATVQFPNVSEDHWSIIRMANGTDRGIMFGNDNKAYIVHGNLMAELYAQNNQPPYPVTSVNGQTGDVVLYASNTVRLPELDDISLHNWNIFRELNNVYRGIQFNDDGSAEIIDGLNRYQLYTTNNPPPYPVTSVNGMTGAVSVYVPTFHTLRYEFTNLAQYTDNVYYIAIPTAMDIAGVPADATVIGMLPEGWSGLGQQFGLSKNGSRGIYVLHAPNFNITSSSYIVVYFYYYT